MKKQKKIDLLTAFQFYLVGKGLINDSDWTFENQAKKFVKKLARQKRMQGMVETDGTANDGINWNEIYNQFFDTAKEKKVKKS